MDPATILELDADQLEAEIRRHDELYWVRAAPEIADETYDAMVERLRRLRPDSPVLVQVGAGEAELAGTVDGAKVVHEHPMLSLDKCYSEDELLRWFDRFGGDAIATQKIDGVAMSLRYGADGALELGATRGNGRVGEDITENCKRIAGVPARVPIGGLEVRGEAYMPLSVFRGRFAERFANPRNLTAGAIKQKDPDKTAEYGLRFFAYDAIGLDEARLETDKRERLRAMGFEPAPGVLCSRERAQATFEDLAAHRDANDFETDGIVFKVNDTSQHETLGMTAHHPRWAIAYKYQGESGFSTLQGIEWSVSRSGTINPVARIAPVFLSGVTVTRVSLHNLAIIEKLAGGALQIGDNPGLALSAGARVLVTRRGGVIPHIEQVAEPGSGTVTVPTECPSCAAPTDRHGDFLSALHERTCATQGIRSLEHFVKVADIQGFGPKVLEQLWDRGFARTPADLYVLTLAQLEDLDRLGRKSAQNLLDQIAARRRLELSTFLAALGIPDLGGQVARFVEEAFAAPREDSGSNAHAAGSASAAGGTADGAAQTDLFGALGDGNALPSGSPRGSDSPPGTPLQRVRAATPEQLAEIPGIGPIVSEKIADGLAERAELIDALLEHVTVEVAERTPRPEAGDNPVAGRSFVFTGAMEQMSREDAQERVRAMGGSTPEGVSAKLDFLVLGEKDFARFEGGWRSSKLKKAEELVASGAGLRIIPESAFVAMLGA